jgi:hypothetical protein
MKLLCLLSSAICLLLSFPTLLLPQYRTNGNDQGLQFFKLATAKYSVLQCPLNFSEWSLSHFTRRLALARSRSVSCIKRTIINADSNGSYNIIRKVAPDAFGSEGVEDCAVHPVRITLTKQTENAANCGYARVRSNFWHCSSYMAYTTCLS